MNPNRRLLVIGGSGFLSGTLARTALARDWSVTVVTRGERPVPAGVEQIRADRHNLKDFAEKLAGIDRPWDLVVDAIPFTPEDALQDVEVFTGHTKRLVLISTDFVYDPRMRAHPQPEDAAAYATGGYGGQKRQAEILLQQTDPSILAWTILRPCHIYGPGSQLGCLPLHSRDPHLVEQILSGQTLRLVGGGRFLQQPIFAPDLSETILDVVDHSAAVGKIFNVAGPEIVASCDYYRVLGSLLGREVAIEEVSTDEFLAAQPDKAPFCCDRVCDLSALRGAGFALPATRLESGLRQQMEVYQSGL